MLTLNSIIQNDAFSKEELVYLLQTEGVEREELFTLSKQEKEKQVGKKVFLRGLIELSNACTKNCYYCGIRKENATIDRYLMATDEVLEAAHYAFVNAYGSIVIQSGEVNNEHFVSYVESLLLQIKKMSNNKLGITLSCGEQSEQTYRRWFEAGAHRYLLRIEASNKALYGKLHPEDELHNYEARVNCLHVLKKIGYQLGTGVMIGLPFQTVSDLADDLLFMRALDIDMCGMGPYVEHSDTPLMQFASVLPDAEKRIDWSLKMIAVLRLMMKDINISATTALSTLSPTARMEALTIGANIFMPNITPSIYRENYFLYDNKPNVDLASIEEQIQKAGCQIARAEWGDSKHFNKAKT